MSQSADSSQYHQHELEIARNPKHPSYIPTPPAQVGERILDVGCGAGQTLLSAYPAQQCFGIDIDLSSLQTGRRWSAHIPFLCARAEALPIADAQIDLVIARVSLPYANLPEAFAEIHRVLRPDGRFWAALHPAEMWWSDFRHGGWKRKLHCFYVLLNSLLFHTAQRMIPFRGSYESFQTRTGVETALRNAGFENVRFERKGYFIVQAEKRR